jgi:hypothetical protein
VAAIQLSEVATCFFNPAYKKEPAMGAYGILAITNPKDQRFGVVPKPLTTRRGMVLGGGRVYPEINFTLPNIGVDVASMPKTRTFYQRA